MNYIPGGAERVRLKVVLIGDGASGKTSLASVYKTGKFPSDYVPTILENFIHKTTFKEKEIDLIIWDTAGQEEYDKLRQLAYANTDVVIITFSLDNKAVSYSNVLSKWIKDAKEEMKGAKIILVGTKMDLLKVQTDVRVKEGWRKETGATKFVEVSAMLNQGVQQVFEEVIKAGLAKIKEENEPEPDCFCNLM